MSERHQCDDSPATSADTTPQEALVYKAAVDLMISTGGQNWARFNAMLVAHSILLAIVGPIVIERRLAALPWYWALIPPVAGLILCLAWGAAMSRGAQYQNVYIGVAREIEEEWLNRKLLNRKLKVVTRGGEKCKTGLGWFRARSAINVVIWLFAALHLILILVVFCRQAGLSDTGGL